MSSLPSVLWLSVSPCLKSFDQRLLCRLLKAASIQRWEHVQAPDQPCCIDGVVAALHQYIRDWSGAQGRKDVSVEPGRRTVGQKLHLIGHGVSGVVALLYARRYPEHLASITLLSVDATPAVNWQAHYYTMRQLVPCCRDVVLHQLAQMLFGRQFGMRQSGGCQTTEFMRAVSQMLAKDLDSNLTLHSLAHHAVIPPGSSQVPLLVCNGAEDAVFGRKTREIWKQHLKIGDRLWNCPDGRHFFHFNHASAAAKVIAEHWQHATLSTPLAL